MRHRKKGRKLGRTASHRNALRRNLAKALLNHERIVTTEAKAKEVKPFVEKLITLGKRALPHKDAPEGSKSKTKYVHHYRQAMSRLQDKKIVQKIFGEGPWREEESLAERYQDRPGGYTRIVNLSGSRLGVPLGGNVGEVTELTYELQGRLRRLRLIGNNLGDNASKVIFELVRKTPPEEEAAPEVDISEEVQKDLSTEESESPEQTPTDAEEATPEEESVPAEDQQPERTGQ